MQPVAKIDGMTLPSQDDTCIVLRYPVRQTLYKLYEECDLPNRSFVASAVLGWLIFRSIGRYGGSYSWFCSCMKMLVDNIDYDIPSGWVDTSAQEINGILMLSEKTIHNVLGDLMELGIVERRWKGSVNNHYEYRVNFFKLHTLVLEKTGKSLRINNPFDEEEQVLDVSEIILGFEQEELKKAVGSGGDAGGEAVLEKVEAKAQVAAPEKERNPEPTPETATPEASVPKVSIPETPDTYEERLEKKKLQEKQREAARIEEQCRTRDRFNQQAAMLLSGSASCDTGSYPDAGPTSSIGGLLSDPGELPDHRPVDTRPPENPANSLSATDANSSKEVIPKDLKNDLFKDRSTISVSRILRNSTNQETPVPLLNPLETKNRTVTEFNEIWADSTIDISGIEDIVPELIGQGRTWEADLEPALQYIAWYRNNRYKAALINPPGWFKMCVLSEWWKKDDDWDWKTESERPNPIRDEKKLKQPGGPTVSVSSNRSSKPGSNGENRAACEIENSVQEETIKLHRFLSQEFNPVAVARFTGFHQELIPELSHLLDVGREDDVLRRVRENMNEGEADAE